MGTSCVVGVGAIGGLLAARLAESGEQVTGIARGATLAAIRRNGLRLDAAGRTVRQTIEVTDCPATAGVHDIVWITLKAHQLTAVASSLACLLGPATTVVTLCNGLPWWYFHECPPPNDRAPEIVDPGGAISAALDPARAIGCVVYPAARVVTPGRVAHVFGQRFSIGEPDGSNSDRLRAVSSVLHAAGFEAGVSADIRAEVWSKLMANAAYNPASLLTGGTLGDLFADPPVRGILEATMAEVASIARAVGSEPPIGPARLIELSQPLAAHKTSMLQDLESGRGIELDAIVQNLRQLAHTCGIDTPMLDTMAPLARQRALPVGL